MTLRRLIMGLCVCLVLCGLAGCAPKAPPPPPAAFSATAKITLGEGEGVCRAVLRQEGPGAITAAFTSPAELVGLELTFEGDMVRLRCRGLQTDIPAAALPQAGFAPVLSRVLLRLAQPGLRYVPTSGGWKLKGQTGGCAFTAALSRDGALRTLRVPATGLQVVLTGVRFA